VLSREHELFRCSLMKKRLVFSNLGEDRAPKFGGTHSPGVNLLQVYSWGRWYSPYAVDGLCIKRERKASVRPHRQLRAIPNVRLLLQFCILGFGGD
jgi:hypothetical protein